MSSICPTKSLSDREPFAGGAAHERFAAARAVEARVADRGLVRASGAAHDDRPAAHPLADAVVGLAVELQRQTARQKRAEALARAARVAISRGDDVLAA